jgi:hypothetical protein
MDISGKLESRPDHANPTDDQLLPSSKKKRGSRSYREGYSFEEKVAGFIDYFITT